MNTQSKPCRHSVVIDLMGKVSSEYSFIQRCHECDQPVRVIVTVEPIPTITAGEISHGEIHTEYLRAN